MKQQASRLIQSDFSTSTPEAGVRTLVAAVIYQAVLDATRQEKCSTNLERERRAKTALAYFRSNLYAHHCQMLDLEPILPPAVAQIMRQEPVEPDDEPASEGLLTRQCVICGTTVKRRRFASPPERTVCGRSQCGIRMRLRASVSDEEAFALHKMYVRGATNEELNIAGRDLSLDPSYYYRVFKERGLPTRGRNGRWRAEDVARILELHDDLTADDVVHVVANGWGNGRRILIPVTQGE